MTLWVICPNTLFWRTLNKEFSMVFWEISPSFNVMVIELSKTLFREKLPKFVGQANALLTNTFSPHPIYVLLLNKNI